MEENMETGVPMPDFDDDVIPDYYRQCATTPTDPRQQNTGGVDE